ncbi:MAG: 50S ribosomal protein L35 [Clostridiales bacterium]|nr:50S ribosomal protein L35 [Clostridiales bacterium]MBP3939969.1 50S ribosomal protein L35 [Christensenellaceae bacterium]MBR2223361.1 50S ribosomal protein L35 [Christensenellaceae bacterium]MBR3841775.1 50S ribosomal protein L35 [Christensenellaceae bacterium]
MPKLKTRRATAKRIRITGSGQIKRYRNNKRHLLNNGRKTSKRKRHLRKATYIGETTKTAKNIKKLMPYA